MSRYSNIETSLAMSTLATWSHLVQSRDVRSRVFSRPSLRPNQTTLRGALVKVAHRWVLRLVVTETCLGLHLTAAAAGYD